MILGEKGNLVAARFELARVFPTGNQVKLKSSALDHSATLPIRVSLYFVQHNCNSLLFVKAIRERMIVSNLYLDIHTLLSTVWCSILHPSQRRMFVI